MREHKGQSIISLPDEYVVIDTETTGLDYEFCEIIEVCALKICAGQVIDRFVSLIRPECGYVDDFITELTGITNEMLETAPSGDAVFPEFLAFIGSSVLIGHNANFDINFLYDATEKYCGTYLYNDFIDTLRISRKVFPALKHHRLSDIAEACQVSQENAHRAEADCIVTTKCYDYMRSLILSQSTEDEFQRSFKLKTKRYNDSLANITATVDEIDTTNPIYEKNVVFTGTLSCMERKAAFQIVANLGGIPQDSITMKTNYLVIGSAEFVKNVKDGKTAKMKKAESYQKKGHEILILSESAFFDMIHDYM